MTLTYNDLLKQTGLTYEPAPGIVIQRSDTGSRITVGGLSAGPPSGSSNGSIWVATDVDSNGTCWQFQYNAGSASAYKWEFIGGPPVGSGGGAVQPALTLARAGDYMIDWAMDGSTSTYFQCIVSATSGTLSGVYQAQNNSTGSRETIGGPCKLTGAAAGAVLSTTASGGTGLTINGAWLNATPIRVM